MNVLIIDSGISQHPRLKDIIVKTTGFEQQNTFEDIIDSTGHGTAISCLSIRDVKDVELYVLKLFDEQYNCSIEELIHALEYISKNNIYDVINMSFGIVAFNECGQLVELEEKCNILSEQGSILVSAFDNDGALSYPAFFNCVIGVDTSDKARKRSEYEYVCNSCINILGYGSAQKVAWNNPEYTIINGNSFACANITNVILKMLEEGYKKSEIYHQLEKNAIDVRTFDKFIFPIKRPDWISGMHAIIFPFSKEIHSLLAFEELLDFDIVDVYDLKYRAQIGKNIDQIITYKNIKPRKIKNYEDILWDSIDFDSIIIGHMSELSVICKKDILKEIIYKCIKYNKKIYAFDDLSIYQNEIIGEKNVAENIYFPIITYENIPKGRFGKLHNIHTPVLAVIGTSSSQGKFTVQLSLREELVKSGFKVGQIGSEPTAYCFNMDFIYPYGYKSTVYTKGMMNVLFLNQILHEIDMAEKDICLVGTQTNTTFYADNNLENIPLQQLEVLFGLMPDAFIMLINVYDDIDYIIRTMKGTEYLIDSKCLAIIIYPVMKHQTVGNLFKKENIEGTDLYLDFKRKVLDVTQVPVLDLSEVLSSDILKNIVVSFFGDGLE